MKKLHIFDFFKTMTVVSQFLSPFLYFKWLLKSNFVILYLQLAVLKHKQSIEKYNYFQSRTAETTPFNAKKKT